jgi:hypothetical protein
VRGVELRRGRPIFYSLGNFVNETEHIARFPSETYETLALGGEADVQNLRAERARLKNLANRKPLFVGLVATLSISAGKVERIRLHPLDLKLDGGVESGRPQLADPSLGREIVATLQRNSRVFGTRIRYDLGTNSAEVDCA